MTPPHYRPDWQTTIQVAILFISFVILSLSSTGCVLESASQQASRPSQQPFEVGLWVQAEGSHRTLDSIGKIQTLLAQARNSGVTDIYAQVYRSGRAWFPTDLADDSPSKHAGGDPLSYLLSLAKQHNREKGAIRVHAWLNVFALARNRQAPILKNLGREAVLRDQYGRSLLDYPQNGKPAWAKGFGLGTPGIFLDPANLAVRRRFGAIVSELLRRYPTLFGIHLDFIRYPYALPISPGSRFSPRLDFGYGKKSMERFRAETGRLPPTANTLVSGNDYEAWDHWRRKQVSETIREARKMIQVQRPYAQLSAAVLPWAERAYLSAFQDWRGWLATGLLDKALVMNYSQDFRLASQISRASLAARDTGGVRYNRLIVIGIGAWLFATHPTGMWRQWRDARSAGADGVALFSYDQMVGRPEMWRFPNP